MATCTACGQPMTPEHRCIPPPTDRDLADTDFGTRLANRYEFVKGFLDEYGAHEVPGETVLSLIRLLAAERSEVARMRTASEGRINHLDRLVAAAVRRAADLDDQLAERNRQIAACVGALEPFALFSGIVAEKETHTEIPMRHCRLAARVLAEVRGAKP